MGRKIYIIFLVIVLSLISSVFAVEKQAKDPEVKQIKKANTPHPGKTWKEPITGMEFVWIPGGCFQMGQTELEKKYLMNEVGDDRYDEYWSNELPQHTVCIDGFWIGKNEVTVEQFRRFVNSEKYQTQAEREGLSIVWNGSEWEKKAGINWQNPDMDQFPNHPVVHVSWNDAEEFVRWLSEKGEAKFRLPTEAEWECACRAGTKTIRFWGDSADDACRYANGADQSLRKKFNFPGTLHECDDKHIYTAPVGSFKPNPFGLYDMLGNVWEWCEDRYAKDAYSEHVRNNPRYTGEGSNRVMRGGSWASGPGGVRCGRRLGGAPDYRDGCIGFRLARTS